MSSSNRAAEDQYAFNQETLIAFDSLETSYNQQLRKGERYKKAGRFAIVAPVVAAGALMTISHAEKSNLGYRMLTDIGAGSIACLGGLIGWAQSEERRLHAGSIAAKTMQASAECGVDPPSWASQGARELNALRQEIDERTRRNTLQ